MCCYSFQTWTSPTKNISFLDKCTLSPDNIRRQRTRLSGSLLWTKTTPWDEVEQRKFKSIQASMPWFSVHHPSLLDPTAIKYIKEVWFFNKKPLLVVLDPHRKVVNANAIHMCWIWGNMAFPCTTLRGSTLGGLNLDN
ncbi:hypothetical protein ACSBR2_036307 [Camellia fascicularis]